MNGTGKDDQRRHRLDQQSSLYIERERFFMHYPPTNAFD